MVWLAWTDSVPHHQDAGIKWQERRKNGNA
jgi:hypothetical protein